jgi:hypothetical protein
MSDMAIGHHQVIITYAGRASANASTSMQSHAFAKHVVVTDFEPRIFAFKFLVCRIFTDRTKLKETIILAYEGVGSYHHM